MYTNSKLSPESLQFIEKTGTQPNEQELISMSIGKVVSSNLLLPASPVVSPGEYYLAEQLKNVRNIVSFYTDVLPINIDRVLELTRALWLVRYRAAFPTSTIYINFVENTESVFLGYGSVLSVAEIRFIQENTQKLVSLHNAFSKIYRECTQTEEPVVEEFRIGK